MFLNKILLIFSFFVFFVSAKRRDFDPEKYARKSVYNAVERVRNRITTTPATPEGNPKNDKNDKSIMRTMAIIEAKSADGRILMLFCDNECGKERKQIPLWIREFNINYIRNADPISYHYHHRKQKFGYYDVDEKLDKNPVVLVYFVANTAFNYDGSLDNKSEFFDFLEGLETQPILKPKNWKELDEIITAASVCDSNQKYVLKIHNFEECRDESWDNLVRTFHSQRNITFVEVVSPISNEETVILQKRLPGLRKSCQITAILHNGGYEELHQATFLKDLNEKISEWGNENCTFPEFHKIKPPLTEIQLDYLSEELMIQDLERNPIYIVVGATGGIGLPLAVGNCKFNITRYYYDKNTNQCYKFIYKGCKGNGNRFISDKQCRQRCRSKDSTDHLPDVFKDLIKPKSQNKNLTCENCHTINGICVDGKCQCRMGYQLVNFRCVDVDECLWTKCSPNAVCMNSLGSFRCECDLGFAGSGLNCSRERGICGQNFDSRYEESCGNMESPWQQRYFYNFTGGFCQQFRYGGCQFEGAQNIFRDLQACQAHCQGFRKRSRNDQNFTLDNTIEVNSTQISVSGPCYDSFDQSKRYPCTKSLWKPRYYFDTKSRRCRMFWYDESCDNQVQKSSSRNIFVHLRTCEQVCERVVGNMLESENRGIAGVIQAVFDKNWTHAKALQGNLQTSRTPPSTTTIPDFTINLFPDEYFITPQPLPQTPPTITGNEIQIEEDPSVLIDHQHISESQRQNILGSKTKLGPTLDPMTNYSMTARMPLTVAEECLDNFDQSLTKSCEESPKWKERYFYDQDLRTCRMYWYGGCWSHSRNNFEDSSTCKWKCEGKHHKHESHDCLEKFDETYLRDCRNGMFEIRYYFNHDTKKCHSFYYGGCHSSSKNFYSDLGECQKSCESVPKDISNFCLHPFDPVYKESCSSGSSWSQYYYFDRETDSCKMFWYGNCKSESQNIFATLETCQWLCERKRESKVPSHCMDKFDAKYREACNGGKWKEKHYFDHTIGQCKAFWYDGCVSESQNIFSSRDLCRSLCEVPSLTTEAPSKNATNEIEDDSVHCLEPLAVGNCKDTLPAYFYNTLTHRCEPFSYSGCRGNGNRFLTLSQCETTCKRYFHLSEEEAHCFSPLSIGFGRKKKACIKNAGYYFYYNVKEGRCGRFWFLGCGGNMNKFRTSTECEHVCRRSRTTPLEISESVSVSACFEAVSKGVCENTVEQMKMRRWGYVASSGRCEEFDYSGCGGNKNKFATENECLKLCKGLKPPNSMQCAHLPDWGPCNRLRYMWYYNLTSGICEQFLYGGCGGNENRFSTFEHCQITCEVAGEDPCLDKLDRGKWCESMSNRYYFHAKSKTCKGFHYTGCGQSRNNFHHLDECEAVCVHRTKTYEGSMEVAKNPKKTENPGTSIKYVGKKPAEQKPMQMHTILSERDSQYLKTEGQWVEYGHCLGFRYNISGEYTRLKSFICLMEEGGTCQIQTLTNTNGEERCRVIRPWLRGSHYYSWFFTIERNKTPWSTDFTGKQKKRQTFQKPQQAADTVASLLILPLNDCYNIC